MDYAQESTHYPLKPVAQDSTPDLDAPSRGETAPADTLATEFKHAYNNAFVPQAKQAVRADASFPPLTSEKEPISIARLPQLLEKPTERYQLVGQDQVKGETGPLLEGNDNDQSFELQPGEVSDFTVDVPGEQKSYSMGGYFETDTVSSGEPEPQPTNLIWWPAMVIQSFHSDNQVETVDSDALLHLALANSPRIRAISQTPLVRDLQVVEADAEFDIDLFTRSMFEDRTDPVGNTLTTGGAPFLEDHIWSGETGIRKKLRRGGELELGQKLGFQNNNSRFFVPQDQGTATLALNYRQPLLRGRGTYINRAQILIAQATGGAAWDLFATELQDEIQNVLVAYWQLYYDRSIFLQKKRNVERGQQILDTLVKRQFLDSLPSQIARARSSVASRKSDLANAFRDVRNAETELRRLVADPDWLSKQQIEMLPVEHPLVEKLEIPLRDVVLSALENRPEIRESVKRARIAAIRCNITENELRPSLNLLFGGYVSALQPDSGIVRAFQDQFSATPGYSFGMEYEIPYRNRLARSRWAQTKVQLNKIQSEVQETTQQVIADTQTAYRRVQSAIETLEAAYVSIQAAYADVQQQQIRWESFGLVEGDVGNGQTPTTILDQLLDAQQRLNNAELSYSQTLLELQVSVVGLHRATGTLLIHRQVDFVKSRDGWIPNVAIFQETAVNEGEGLPPESAPAELGK